MNHTNSQNRSFYFQNGSIPLSGSPVGMGYYELMAVSVLFGILLLAILLGNGLILASVLINKKLRTITNQLVVGLAISDVLVGLVLIPCWVYVYIYQFKRLSYSSAVYQFYIVFDIFIGSASILQLTAIGIERCHAVVRPFRHRTLPKRAFYAMVSVPWFYAGLLAVLQPVQYKSWREVYTILMTSTCFLGPLLINIVSYSFIVKFAFSKPSRKLTEHKIPNSVYRKEIKLSVTLALITALFVVAWLPLFVVTVIGTYHPQHFPSPVWTDRLLKFVKWMHYGNSAVNPFFYAYRNRDIILTFRFIVLRLVCRNVQLIDLHHVTGCSTAPPKLVKMFDKKASGSSSFSRSSYNNAERKSFRSLSRNWSHNNNDQSLV